MFSNLSNLIEAKKAEIQAMDLLLHGISLENGEGSKPEVAIIAIPPVLRQVQSDIEYLDKDSHGTARHQNAQAPLLAFKSILLKAPEGTSKDLCKILRREKITIDPEKLVEAMNGFLGEGLPPIHDYPEGDDIVGRYADRLNGIVYLLNENRF